jgi:hypothetical protein
MWIIQFFENVGASIVGGIILIVVAGLLSRNTKWILVAILSRIVNSDLEYVYRNKEDAKEDMIRDLEISSKVYLFTSRGNELQRGLFNTIFHKKDVNRKVSIKILLPDFNVKKGEVDWLMEREKETATFDKAFGNGLLCSQVKSTAEFLKQYVKDGEVELKLYNQPHMCRIMITDKFAYHTPYDKNRHGSENSIYKYRRGGTMYDNLKRQCDQYWITANKFS